MTLRLLRFRTMGSGFACEIAPIGGGIWVVRRFEDVEARRPRTYSAMCVWVVHRRRRAPGRFRFGWTIASTLSSNACKLQKMGERTLALRATSNEPAEPAARPGTTTSTRSRQISGTQLRAPREDELSADHEDISWFSEGSRAALPPPPDAEASDYMAPLSALALAAPLPTGMYAPPDFGEVEQEFWNQEPSYPSSRVAPSAAPLLQPVAPRRRNRFLAMSLFAVALVALAVLLSFELGLLLCR